MPPKAIRIVNMDGVDGKASPSVVTSIPDVQVTREREPFIQPEDDQRLPHTGMPHSKMPGCAMCFVY